MSSSYKTIGTLFILLLSTYIYKDAKARWVIRAENTKKEARKYEHLK